MTWEFIPNIWSNEPEWFEVFCVETYNGDDQSDRISKNCGVSEGSQILQNPESDSR